MVRRKIIKRKIGRGSHKCIKCGNLHGVIRSHNLFYCRRCFREVAKDLGFKKYK